MARPFEIAATDGQNDRVALFQRFADNPVPRDMIAPVPMDDQRSGDVTVFQQLADNPVPRSMITPVPMDGQRSGDVTVFQQLADDPIPRAMIEPNVEPDPSQPYIDGLAPVTLGSDWRKAVLRASKLNDTVTLPVMDPVEGGIVGPFGPIFIPCGDRIPEFGDILVEGPYTLPPGPGLDDDRTIIIVDGVVAYMSGSPQNGWAVTSVPNAINGFDYTLTTTSLMVGAILIEVYLEGVESFYDSYTVDAATLPTIINVTPGDEAVDVDPFQVVSFDVFDYGDDVLPAGTSVEINGVEALYRGQGANGFIVEATRITNGYHYEISAPRAYAYGSTVELYIYAEDFLSFTVESRTTFRIIPSDICFEGPLTVFEDLLLEPFTAQPALEQLRLALLTNLVTDLNATAAARAIYLRTYETDLFPMLVRLVPTPSSTLRDTHICAWASAIEVYDVLSARLPRLMEIATRELSALNLPVEYTDTIRRYAGVDNEPTVLINLACFLLVMGKALTNPDLV
jgi:hypothetical protein